jgi:hypothetical protein
MQGAPKPYDVSSHMSVQSRPEHRIHTKHGTFMEELGSGLP